MDMADDDLRKNGEWCWNANEEFLIVLFDFLHVAWRRCPPFSFILNGNGGFLLDQLPDSDHSMSLHWARVTGDEQESFESIYRNKLPSQCHERGFDLSDCASIYYLVGTGEECIEPDFIAAVQKITNSGFTVDEAVDLLKAEARGEPETFTKQVFAGFLHDPSLQNRYCVSVLALAPLPSVKPVLSLIKS
jgi:hypothetical protein